MTASRLRSAVGVVLAAGKGIRFGSLRPKVLQPLAGRSILGHIVHALSVSGVERTVLVVGHGADEVRAEFPTLDAVEQTEQRGTGHALLQSRTIVRTESDVVLVNGDLPLIDAPLIGSVVDVRLATGKPMVALTCIAGDTAGMGRVVRDAEGRPRAIVEERDATADQLALPEWNVGLYVFAGEWLWPRLERLAPSRSGEIYITDLFALAAAEDALATAVTRDAESVRGINTRADLAAAEHVLRQRIRGRLLANGVTLISPETSVIDDTVLVGRETTVLPGCVITGDTAIGRDCRIGPQAIIADSQIGDAVVVGPAVLTGASVPAGAVVPAYSVIGSG